MITPSFVQTMALYNQWQNEQLLEILDALSGPTLQADRDLFFGSILGTLNHIMHVDRAIYGLIQTQTLPVDFDPRAVPYPTYAEFKPARVAWDQALVQAAQGVTQEWLDEIFEFWSDRHQRQRRIPRGFYYMQLFNHQTHHRGQITAALHKMGIDYGSTDLPFNPYNPF